jgi:hypothetical protein
MKGKKTECYEYSVDCVFVLIMRVFDAVDVEQAQRAEVVVEGKAVDSVHTILVAAAKTTHTIPKVGVETIHIILKMNRLTMISMRVLRSQSMMITAITILLSIQAQQMIPFLPKMPYLLRPFKIIAFLALIPFLSTPMPRIQPRVETFGSMPTSLCKK